MGGACCCDDREMKVRGKDSPTKILRAKPTPKKDKFQTPTKMDQKTSKITLNDHKQPQVSAAVAIASPVRLHDVTLQDIEGDS